MPTPDRTLTPDEETRLRPIIARCLCDYDAGEYDSMYYPLADEILLKVQLVLAHKPVYEKRRRT